MNAFLNNIVLRHTKPLNQVMPRLRGIFEQESMNSGNMKEDLFGKEITDKPLNRSEIFPNENERNKTSIKGDSPGFNVNQTSGLNGGVTGLETEHDNNYKQPAEIRPSFIENSVEPVNNEVHLNQQKVLNSFVVEKKDLTTQQMLNKNAILDDPRSSPSKEIVPVSVKIIKDDLQPGHESARRDSGARLNQKKLSPETLSWARNFKNMINIPNAEVNSYRPSVIKVNIGRIDVCASTQQTAAKTKADPRPEMTLDDFLKKKNGV